ncbi:MAG: hypothetical protein JWR32_4311 [Mycobacterium sp.]|jgi:hypothetical protein|nr:hypothetical protein [Mycobacterium sp.]
MTANREAWAVATAAAVGLDTSKETPHAPSLADVVCHEMVDGRVPIDA